MHGFNKCPRCGGRKSREAEVCGNCRKELKLYKSLTKAAEEKQKRKDDNELRKNGYEPEARDYMGYLNA